MGSFVVLSQSDSHHLRDVLRLGIGARVEVRVASLYTTFLGIVSSLDQDVRLKLQSTIEAPAATALDCVQPIEISLLFALCKGDKNDSIADWGTELGCSAITFWQSEKSVVRLRTDSDASLKEDRLSKISAGAAKQSRQDSIPRIAVRRDLASALVASGVTSFHLTAGELRICCSLSSGATTLSALQKSAPSPHLVHLVIGPEGDLTHDEESMLLRHGFVMVRLDQRVLRAELAAVAAVLATRITFSL